MENILALARSTQTSVLGTLQGQPARPVKTWPAGIKKARAVTVQDLIRFALASEVPLSILTSSGAPPPGRSTEA